ncbi:MAG: amino acid permease [Oscillospiraceae bacterium]|nr:amino acid permease [Oscillospiraceae bacterium]
MSSETKLRQHLSPMGAWAFSVGTSVGWGSLVVTASTYLAQAGPLGSVFGLAAGAMIMLIISRCYAYLMRCFPEAGGAFSFSTEVFGHDQGFLTAWFLAMTYFAILWANATSLPLFSRIFLGDVFRFGKLYTIFGYDVFAGEALLSVAALILVGWLCAHFARVMDKVMIALACTFTLGIAVCFFGAVFGHPVLTPFYIPDSSALSQIVKIAVISPWAFIGFESISHATEEFSFDRGKIRIVLLIAVLSALALYGMVTLLSVTAYPDRYDSWLSYIRDLDNLEGLEALPAFYAAGRYLGSAGVTLLMLSLLALVLTSLIGNISALSRLFWVLGKERILPERFAVLNENGVPAQALLLTVGVSCLVPLIGRTAIGWIVDVTTIGATLIYGYVSAAAARYAREMEDRRDMWFGRIGLGLMFAFGLYILLPNIIGRGSMAKETYFLFIAWSVLGFLFFRGILHHDKEKRFGGSVTVWVALLALVLFVSLIWMRQSMIDANEEMLDNIRNYYGESESLGVQRLEDSRYIEQQMLELEESDTQTMLMAIGMFGFALLIMMTNHRYMNKRSKESEMLANTDPMTGVKSKLAYFAREKELNTLIEETRANDFSIVVCDVNGLKKINDTLGHKAGDAYICDACRMVCETFQHSPVYRVGGDEFVVILTGRDHLVRRELMTALHEKSVEHIASGGAVISGGMADFIPAEDGNVHEVFERADAQMYEEKQLLKSFGAVTRDDESEESALLTVSGEAPAVLNVSRKILIVEDEVVNQMMLGKALEDEYEILYASDGLVALEEIRAHKDDLNLILLDLLLPKMSGTEVLRSIKADPELKHIPVIVMTSDHQSEVECLEIGAMDFISKPYPAWEVVHARVKKSIEYAESRETIQSTERDHLTKLFNIDYFFRYIGIFDRHYVDMDMDAVVIDVNHFHLVNERYGKQYGDTVLMRIGERIRHLAREVGGVGCRQGADTFLIYCPHRTDYADLLEEASKGLSGEDASDDRIRLRMGVYANVDKELDIERRFDRAKLAADSVKDNYVQPVGVFDQKMNDTALFREALLEGFHSSLDEGRFSVVFQPKFDIRPEKPVLASAEALVRWNHPVLGPVSPGVFIPLLEDNGLILELDIFVWRETARRIREWKDKFGFSVPVSVNVSRIDMLMPNLKSIFTEILDSRCLTTADLILEITESAYTGDSSQVIAVARELRGTGMGFRIEMDDFGTGYSSLGMLSNLPIDVLKLDMSFVRSAFGETRDFRIIELIIDIADYLQVPLVAEGVETEEQYLKLRDLGCDLVQGYYFSRPLPPDQFEQFLSERKGSA